MQRQMLQLGALKRVHTKLIVSLLFYHILGNKIDLDIIVSYKV